MVKMSPFRLILTINLRYATTTLVSRWFDSTSGALAYLNCSRSADMRFHLVVNFVMAK